MTFGPPRASWAVRPAHCRSSVSAVVVAVHGSSSSAPKPARRLRRCARAPSRRPSGSASMSTSRPCPPKREASGQRVVEDDLVEPVGRELRWPGAASAVHIPRAVHRPPWAGSAANGYRPCAYRPSRHASRLSSRAPPPEAFGHVYAFAAKAPGVLLMLLSVSSSRRLVLARHQARVEIAAHL